MSIIDLQNNWERFVAGKDDKIGAREFSRYNWARKYVGPEVLEIGCSSGYGLRILGDVKYHGVDYDAKIVEFAKENFGDRFEQADINSYDFGFHDTIIAFEVLEHIDNGREMAQKLKAHCNTLLISCPYNETPGTWGIHHKLHRLTEKDFPGFEYIYMDRYGNLTDHNTGDEQGLILMRWTKHNVLCEICTKDRYYTTLPLVIEGVLMQTRKPNSLVLFDDSDKPIDLRKEPLYQYLFQQLDGKGIKWQVIYGQHRGQHFLHQKAQKMGAELVWRVDDDTVPESNVLEALLGELGANVGAVAGLVLMPNTPFTTDMPEKDSFNDNFNWKNFSGKKEAHHLYSSFLFRSGIADYELSLSKVAHREETIFSHRIFRKGWKLIVTSACKTWHLRNPEGGIRTGVKDDWDHDEKMFQEMAKEWEEKKLTVFLDNGKGDHLCFRSILPKLKEKYDVTIACCYPELFEGEKVISIAEGGKIVSPDRFNIYKWMDDHQWTGELKDAFLQMYDN